MKKKILVPYATYGNGHKSVARYIEEYFTKQDENIEVLSIDLLDYTSLFIRVVSKKIFEKTMFSRLPILWEIIYKFYNNKYRSIGTKKMCYSFFDRKKLREKVKDFNPDIVISTHFFGSILFSKYKKIGFINAKLYTIITDYELHEFWLKSLKYETAVIVSNQQMKKQLLKRGISSDKIKVYGIPLSDNFSHKFDVPKLKKKFKIKSNKTIILFFCGNNNSLTSLPFVKKLLKYSESFYIILITGKNNKLKAKINKLGIDVKDKDVKVLGYVNDVYEYMSISDIIITKPGGLTVSECLVLQKPMILINHNAGQEKGNYKYLVHQKYALKASNPYKFNKCLKLIQKDPKIIKKMKYQILKDKKDSAIKQLYNLVMK